MDERRRPKRISDLNTPQDEVLQALDRLTQIRQTQLDQEALHTISSRGGLLPTEIDRRDGEEILLRPACKFECTHVDTVTIAAASGRSITVTAEGEDGNSTVRITAADDATAQGRRHEIRLTITCEAGCTTEVVLRQHKGTTYIAETGR
jgi:hypothetical protein